jgi:hypothetical protein
MARRFLLYEKEEFWRVSTWTDSLHCSILKNGTISLRLNKHGGDGSWWVPAIRNIRTPKQFLDSFRSIEHIEWDIEDILPALHKEHPVFAVLVEKELELEILEEDIECKIQNIIEPIVKQAELNHPSGTTNARVFNKEVKEFTKLYLLKTGSIPNGEHEIQGRKVKFR